MRKCDDGAHPVLRSSPKVVIGVINIENGLYLVVARSDGGEGCREGNVFRVGGYFDGSASGETPDLSRSNPRGQRV
jgi:hypothetical protein